MSESDWVDLINLFTLVLSILCGLAALVVGAQLWIDRPWKKDR